MDNLKRFTRLAALILALAAPMPLLAAAGKVVIAAGDVFAVNAQEQRRTLQRRSEIFEGDTLITGENSRLQLRFEDNAILALRANSQLRISEYHGGTDAQQERVLMDLLGGGFRTISGSFGKSDRDAYQVRTPNASIGIRGTHYEAVFASETLTVGVYEGGISITNDQGTLNLGLDSDFLYAQVEAGNLPQGLLNPPENLNVPNTPETDEEGEEGSDEEEGGSDESGGEEGGANDDADLGDDDAGENQDPNSSPGSTPPPIPDANEISEDDFNFSALEDAVNEELAKLDNDEEEEEEEEAAPVIKTVELTDEEQEALQADNAVVGILAFAPSDQVHDGPFISYSGITGEGASGEASRNDGEQANQSYFFVAYDSQGTDDLSGNVTLPNAVIRPDGSPSDSSYAEANTYIGWEIWNQEASDISIEAGDETSFTSTSTDQPFYYIIAEPNTSDLSGKGPVYFELTELVTNQTGLTESGFGGMTVDFSTLEATGQLAFSPSSQSGWSTWDLEFEGQISGTSLTAELTGNSTLEFYDNSEAQIGDTHILSGNVNGIITGNESNVGITGGFSAESNDSDDEAYGVFVMEEYNPQEIN